MVKLVTAASSAVRAELARPPQTAAVLGVTRGALYLSIPGSPRAAALLAYDAVRLPFGLILPATSAELPLSAIAPRDGQCLFGGGGVRWAGPDGPVTVTASREWAPRRVCAGLVNESALASVRAGLQRLSDHDVDAGLVALLTGVSSGITAVGALLGRGGGLTPAGDDVLAGFLLGARAFGLYVPGIASAVSRLAPVRTTALSAALLWHAARGQCIDEVAALTNALAGRGAPEPALTRLLAVGHTSGAALASGVVAAAEAAQPGRAAA